MIEWPTDPAAAVRRSTLLSPNIGIIRAQRLINPVYVPKVLRRPGSDRVWPSIRREKGPRPLNSAYFAYRSRSPPSVSKIPSETRRPVDNPNGSVVSATPIFSGRTDRMPLSLQKRPEPINRCVVASHRRSSTFVQESIRRSCWSKTAPCTGWCYPWPAPYSYCVASHNRTVTPGEYTALCPVEGLLPNTGPRS